MKRGTKTADKRTLQFVKGFADDLEAHVLLIEKGWLFEEYQVVDAKKSCVGVLFLHIPNSC